MKVKQEIGKKSVRIKKNDIIKVISGRDRGKTGRILKVFPAKGTAIVENINFVKKATRANPNRNIKGGIIEKEAEIRLSNIMFICPDCSKPSRIGIEILEDGKRVRFCKKCSAMVDK
jgi:large subunit ribosomal protein L24